MASILYYVVQVEHCYYQKTVDGPKFTADEEQAFAFTDITDAEQLAIEVHGTVLTREVSYEELEALSAHHWAEYEALSKEERDAIESICRELKIERYE